MLGQHRLNQPHILQQLRLGASHRPSLRRLRAVSLAHLCDACRWLDRLPGRVRCQIAVRQRAGNRRALIREVQELAQQPSLIRLHVRPRVIRDQARETLVARRPVEIERRPAGEIQSAPALARIRRRARTSPRPARPPCRLLGRRPPSERAPRHLAYAANANRAAPTAAQQPAQPTTVRMRVRESQTYDHGPNFLYWIKAAAGALRATRPLRTADGARKPWPRA